MAELSGSVNRITVERMRNQQMVRDFNKQIRTFPRTVVASVAGYRPKPYFEASAAAQSAPQVKF